MPVSPAARRRIREFLDDDDEIRYVFPADVLMSASPSVLFVVSRKSITILSTGIWSRKRPKSVVARLSRRTVLGPVDTTETPFFSVNGIGYEIDDEYVAVVHAADAEITTAGDALPPDPLPDL